MSENFQVGDVVRLKSGGPAMTITYVGADEAACEWFDEKKNMPQQRDFHMAALNKIPPMPSSDDLRSRGPTVV